MAMLYLPFWALLRKETFFRLNRCVLLAITVASMLLPFADAWGITFPGELASSGILSIRLPKVEVLASSHATSMWSWWGVLCVAYWVGAISCFLYKAIDMFRLVRFIPNGCLWTQIEDGIHIHCHARQIAPFSWMNRIVISEKDYHENGNEILLHERAHIKNGHSWDMLWLSVVEVLQWFNPFVWMLAKDIRDIHEYEADLAVLQEGVNARSYQLLLIKKAVGNASFAFVNSFNHSLLKKRITMMIRRKSNPWARVKLVYLLPVAVLCMMACTSNTPSPVSIAEVKEVVATEEVAMVEPEQVFKLVEEQAVFPGGYHKLLQYLRGHLQYPEIAMREGIQGRVCLEFTIDKEGNLLNPNIIKGIHPALDKEALRILEDMPKWTPAKKNGEKVASLFYLPITFKLQ